MTTSSDLSSTFLTGLSRRGVTLRVVRDRLIVEAPAGTITSADRYELARHKRALLAVAYELRLLRVAEAAVRTARPATDPHDFDVRMRVVQMYREILHNLFSGQLDPLRLEIAGAVERLAARWCVLVRGDGSTSSTSGDS